jgi:hypothetical protein
MRSDAGGKRAAACYSLVEAAKLKGLDPQDHLFRDSKHGPQDDGWLVGSQWLRAAWIVRRRAHLG